MKRIWVGFSENWPDMIKVHGAPAVFSLQAYGDTVREALEDALRTHHTFVAPLFDEYGELKLPPTISLWLDKKDGQGSNVCNSSKMLDSPLGDAWKLSVVWTPDRE